MVLLPPSLGFFGQENGSITTITAAFNKFNISDITAEKSDEYSGKKGLEILGPKISIA